MGILIRHVDILLCPFWATTSSAALEGVLRSIAAQEGVHWRVIMVDGTRGAMAEEMAREILPPARLEYDRPHVKGVQQGTLYWQAMLGANARHIAYADARTRTARSWRRDHLFMLTDLIKRGRGDFVFSGPIGFDGDPEALASEVAQRPIVPLGTVVHRADVYGRLAHGWDRFAPGETEHRVWQEIALLRKPRVGFYHFGLATAPRLVCA